MIINVFKLPAEKLKLFTATRSNKIGHKYMLFSRMLSINHYSKPA